MDTILVVNAGSSSASSFTKASFGIGTRPRLQASGPDGGRLAARRAANRFDAADISTVPAALENEDRSKADAAGFGGARHCRSPGQRRLHVRVLGRAQHREHDGIYRARRPADGHPPRSDPTLESSCI
jgi:hypothetical protein